MFCIFRNVAFTREYASCNQQVLEARLQQIATSSFHVVGYVSKRQGCFIPCADFVCRARVQLHISRRGTSSRCDDDASWDKARNLTTVFVTEEPQ